MSGTTGGLGELAAHPATEAPAHDLGQWVRSRRMEGTPARDHLLKPTLATRMHAQVGSSLTPNAKMK